jgi:hypothetical protein
MFQIISWYFWLIQEHRDEVEDLGGAKCNDLEYVLIYLSKTVYYGVS